MDMKAKLVELVKNALAAYGSKTNEVLEPCEFIADFMMVNGVTVQEWISVEERFPALEDALVDGSVYAYTKAKKGACFTLSICLQAFRLYTLLDAGSDAATAK